MPLFSGGGPLDNLLRSRGAQQGTFTSQLTPPALQKNPFELITQSSQLSNFYNQMTSIGDRIKEQKAAAEDAIYRQMQKKQEDALMKKIKASMPQALPNVNLPNYGGGNPSGGGYSPSPLPNLPKKSPGIKLPNINTPQTPVVAPPRVPVYIPGLGWNWI